MKKNQVFNSQYDLVVVEWEDIFTSAGWKSEQEVLMALPAKCVTVGFLLSQDKERIIIGSGYADDGDISDMTIFPIGVIRNIVYVSQVNKIEPSTQRPKHVSKKNVCNKLNVGV